jgi:flagellar basal-body rod protein FlgB
VLLPLAWRLLPTSVESTVGDPEAIDMDKLFGLHGDALVLRSRRSEVLARNLANADTPNYEARDFDFSAALRAASEAQTGASSTIAGRSGGLAVTSAGHIAAGGASNDTDLLYRVPMQPSIDGNTVDTDMERSEFMRNALAYEASLRFLNSKVRSLIGALKGE